MATSQLVFTFTAFLILSYSDAYLESEESDDYIQCSRHYQSLYGYIIDIKSSVAVGAKLLEGIQALSYDDCVEQCCASVKCDLALYRLRGISHVGHNCYFVHCGRRENCHTAIHEEFVSIYMNTNKEQIGHGREHSFDSSTTEPTSSSQPTAGASTIANVTEPDSQPTAATSDLNPNDNDTLKDHINSTASTKNDTKADENGKTPISSVIISATPNVIVGDQDKDNDVVSVDDPCAKYGCNKGSGVIAVGVVGGVAFIAIFIVSILVAKKLYENRKKRHYHNVDYLINGMYS